MYSIPTRALRAAIGCAATLDARYYLKCVRIMPMPNIGGVMLQATDGMLAAIVYCGDDSKAADNSDAVLLPAEELKKALAYVRAPRAGLVQVDASGTVSAGTVSAKIEPCVANYPDLSRIFQPAADNSEASRMASGLHVYVKFLAAANALHGFAPRKAAGAQIEHCAFPLIAGDGWTVSDGVDGGVKMIAATSRRRAACVENTRPSLARFAGWPTPD